MKRRDFLRKALTVPAVVAIPVIANVPAENELTSAARKTISMHRKRVEAFGLAPIHAEGESFAFDPMWPGIDKFANNIIDTKQKTAAQILNDAWDAGA